MIAPDEFGIDPSAWSRVLALASSMTDEGAVPALAVDLVRNGRCLERPLMFGRQRLNDDPGTLRDDAVFLVASLTKPFVAMAAMLLVEQGRLALNERVVDLIPEFDAPSKRSMTVRHLLTHTSGLPDMLPHNRRLRETNSPLTSFLSGALAVTLDFPPGSGVQYQSMGFVLLAEIVSRVSGLPCREFLRSHIFDPLGMHGTSLGAPDDWFEGDAPRVDRIVEVAVEAEQVGQANWNWNSRYWRQLGAPWGGLLTTPRDLAVFCRMMLAGGEWGGVRIFSPSTITTATTNQLCSLREIPEADRRTRPWGFGWRLNWPAHAASYGDLVGPRTYGHWGATGTMFWIDPDQNAAAVILSTRPFEQSGNHLARLSNAIAAALR
ncbi:MAG: beta-lactamase family protein [Planctomycetaceae bacterium]|nr:beta-lactamase family protein [Planctomycetaceae bacterium]